MKLCKYCKADISHRHRTTRICLECSSSLTDELIERVLKKHTLESWNEQKRNA